MNNGIKSLSFEDRPREKLIEKGSDNLTDTELLAIVIGSGTAKESAIQLASRILKDVGGLKKLAQKNVNELLQIKGIGPAKAVGILAVFEIGRRKQNFEQVTAKITSSKDAFLIFEGMLADLQHEEFWILMLNRANIPIKKYRISKGGVSGTVVDVKILVKEVLNELASGVILCHNHPSGNRTPSQADKQITQKIKNALSLMDVNVLDHIIVAQQSYYSFADEGDL